MEEILSSIKRIIAEEGEETAREAPRASRRGGAPLDSPGDEELISEAPSAPPIEEVLELTDEIALEETMPPITQDSPPKAAPAKAKTARPPVAAPAAEETDGSTEGPAESILSVESEVAARHSLTALSTMIMKPADGGDNTLDGLVRSMLRPMLKEWLDANLPEMVEAMVAKEIARITGRG